MYRSWCISLDTSAAEFVAKQLHMYRAFSLSCAQCSCFRSDDTRWANGNGNYFRIGPPKKGAQAPRNSLDTVPSLMLQKLQLFKQPTFLGCWGLGPWNRGHVILGLRGLPYRLCA
jgi:hypothetical protein